MDEVTKKLVVDRIAQANLFKARGWISNASSLVRTNQDCLPSVRINLPERLERLIKDAISKDYSASHIMESLDQQFDYELGYIDSLKNQTKLSNWADRLQRIRDSLNMAVLDRSVAHRQLEVFLDKVDNAAVKISPEGQEVFSGNFKCDIHYRTEHYDFGTALVSITYGYPVSKKLTVRFEYKDDSKTLLAPSGLPHPHVNGDSLCLGGSAGRFDSMYNQGLIFDMFKTVEGCLNTYFEEGPYEQLYKFRTKAHWKAKKEGRSSSADGHCPGCGDEEADCSCINCGVSLCEDCILVCDNCGDGFCADCARSMPGGNYYCDECFDRLGWTSCYCCGEYINPSFGIGDYCQSCGNDLCNACADWRECKKCGELICEDCAVECRDCGEHMCRPCATVCEGCNELFCDECARSLPDRPEVYYCEECAEKIENELSEQESEHETGTAVTDSSSETETE